MLRMVLVTFATLATIATVSTAARAETAEERQACTDDAMNRCGDFIPDRDRVYQCLVRKVRLLNPACRVIITKSIRHRPHR